MLELRDKINGLTDYKSLFTLDEKEALTQCFTKIQEHIISQYETKNSRDSVELRLHYNAYTHSFLVIDLRNKAIYLSHRDHGSSKDNYFCNDESTREGWKYTLCLIVVERWEEIKGILDNYFSNVKSVPELCSTFNL